MQLAPIIAANLSTIARVANDVVSPSKLFMIASTRFDAALRVLGGDDTAHAPSALASSIASREAMNGVNTLKSVLVPGTPWSTRQRAANSTFQAKRALDVIAKYSRVMAPRGDGPFHRADLATGTLLLLDNARSALRMAIRNLASA